jgi:AcrR family transcriptional regulator
MQAIPAMKKKTGVYHHGDLRSALLRGVAETIKSDGVANVSLREVARRIGVSHGAPAHHFASKQALLTAFATEGFARLGGFALDSLMGSGAKDGRQRLAAIGLGYVRFATAHPEYFEVMFRADLVDAADPAFAAASDSAFGLLNQTVEAIAKEGHLGDIDATTLTAAAWSIAHGFAALVLSKRLGPRTGDSTELGAKVLRLFVESALGWPKGKTK